MLCSVTSVCVQLSLTLWTIAHQVFLSMGYLGRLPCLPPGDLPNPGIKLRSLKPPALQADSLPLSHWGSPILMLCEITQLCPALCNPMESSLPGSSIYGIFQAKILEQVSIYFSRRSSQPRDWIRVSLIVSRRFTVWATREVSCLGLHKWQNWGCW